MYIYIYIYNLYIQYYKQCYKYYKCELFLTPTGCSTFYGANADFENNL